MSDDKTPLINRRFLFRGDDHYRGGPVGIPLGADANAADIQDFAAHVLRKESNRSSRYRSFTTEMNVARRFTSSMENRHISRVRLAVLHQLESQGTIRIWNPDRVYEVLVRTSARFARQAADVRTAMKRNGEILIEGQIPASALEPVH